MRSKPRISDSENGLAGSSLHEACALKRGSRSSLRRGSIAFGILCVTWLLLGARLGGVACAADAKAPVIVSFGDSTTATRGALRVYSRVLQEELPKQGVPVQVINAGVGGNNTVMARKRFQKDVLDRKPAVVIVQFGINDAAVDVWKTPAATEPRVSLKTYEANLRFFIKSIRANGAKPILMTPNPLRWTPKLKKRYGKAPYVADDKDGFNALLREFAGKAREIAKDEKVPLIDIYRAMESSADELLLDGMHPNDKGQLQVAEKLMPVVIAALKK
jgi:lysophospholipase L1-like esterase